MGPGYLNFVWAFKRTIAQESACSNPRPSPNPRQSGHRKRGRKGECGRLACVRCHRQSHELGWMRELLEPLPEGIYRMPSVYGFVKSMRSLAPCIAAVCKLRCRTCPLCAGPCREELAGHLEPVKLGSVSSRSSTDCKRNPRFQPGAGVILPLLSLFLSATAIRKHLKFSPSSSSPNEALEDAH